jgi:plastocyanin
MLVPRDPGAFVRMVLPGMALLGPILSLPVWSDESREIGIDNFKFSPTPLTISQGTELTWTNHDDIPHSIVLENLDVHSRPMDTDGSFSYRFDRTGTFTYICGLHPFMQGKVEVK